MTMTDKGSQKTRDTILYVVVALVYGVIWLASFSHLQRGPFLVLAAAVATAYAVAQGYSMLALGKLALSADNIAFPAGLVTLIVATLVMIKGGWLNAGMHTWIELAVRFFTAFALGHIAVLATAFVADKISDIGT